MHHCWVVESFETSNIASKNVPIMGMFSYFDLQVSIVRQKLLHTTQGMNRVRART